MSLRVAHAHAQARVDRELCGGGRGVLEAPHLLKGSAIHHLYVVEQLGRRRMAARAAEGQPVRQQCRATAGW